MSTTEYVTPDLQRLRLQWWIQRANPAMTPSSLVIGL